MNYDKFFIDIAEKFSELSHCVSLKVGAIAVIDRRIIASGINGTPQGQLNCDDKFNYLDFDKEEHHLWSSIHEIHAEMNVILYCAKNGISLNGATLYCSVEPCIHCTKNLIQSGIVKIIYNREYSKNRNNNEFDIFINNNKNIIFQKFEG